MNAVFCHFNFFSYMLLDFKKYFNNYLISMHLSHCSFYIIFNERTERGHARTNEKMGMFVKYFDGVDGIEAQLAGDDTIYIKFDF